jgi:hypothetical protein
VGGRKSRRPLADVADVPRDLKSMKGVLDVASRLIEDGTLKLSTRGRDGRSIGLSFRPNPAFPRQPREAAVIHAMEGNNDRGRVDKALKGVARAKSIKFWPTINWNRSASLSQVGCLPTRLQSRKAHRLTGVMGLFLLMVPVGSSVPGSGHWWGHSPTSSTGLV